MLSGLEGSQEYEEIDGKHRHVPAHYNELKKQYNYDQERPMFNDSSNWIEINNKVTRTNELEDRKAYEVPSRVPESDNEKILQLKNMFYHDSGRTQSYTHIPMNYEPQLRQKKSYEIGLSEL
uniref:Uncharacterized protein n=1 Tax=Euplotes harpa TaxID=151035 RepID=A0A7S3IZW7_9SPIT|mmetsp:Transcript_12067/g.13730  ORF Transcript_12067/g.13730 Transcript_12067/m.13730 type:complete len:122 (+) Transcript_12067:446-811(+)